MTASRSKRRGKVDVQASRWRRFQAISLALDGMSSAEISAITGMSRDSVMQACCRAGVRMASRSPKAVRVTAAVIAVANGACMVDAAADAGVSLETLRVHMRERGVRSRQTSAGRKDGRSRRAAKAVLFDGLTISEAAKRERSSTAAVSKILKRIKDGLGR